MMNKVTLTLTVEYESGVAAEVTEVLDGTWTAFEARDGDPFKAGRALGLAIANLVGLAEGATLDVGVGAQRTVTLVDHG